ncbi:hypothetical protein [Microbacterium imperiale]|uniref:Uncharacterized protein n=1 Tax=Microbacterium imperiale TaxID=33884 RepID=A0A9W6HFQ9_9MICO|nr:hypothetical protein [Microbacterium imperiale]MBP2419459.1 hypothetical protein [Microbacterium imperiale]MDS0198671.1 hypothetical protein [Microbacterium imperiale]BFE39801.1 hypothetical protein GCM10017544_07570 [Microbacterium imperiale]GLJ79224.1 hypothetical protein GCM10017586_09060 [Microbacterium imperiale]
MEIPQPPRDPKARARNHQLMIAGLLSSSVGGLFLVLAIDDPGNLMRWLVLAGWIALAVAGNIYAWRRYYHEYPPDPWPGSPPPGSSDVGSATVTEDGRPGSF